MATTNTTCTCLNVNVPALPSGQCPPCVSNSCTCANGNTSIVDPNGNCICLSGGGSSGSGSSSGSSPSNGNGNNTVGSVLAALFLILFFAFVIILILKAPRATWISNPQPVAVVPQAPSLFSVNL